MVIFLKGNLSDGFEAFGPYNNYDEAAKAHPSEEGRVMDLLKPQGEAWEHDAIQFPRLLSEIQASGLKEEQLNDLQASMDLGRTDIQELFDRAEKSWDGLKEKTIETDFEECDECGERIPDSAPSEINGFHKESCSLHPSAEAK